MRIKVRVKPNSGQQLIKKINKDEYKVYLKSQAKEGKANVELVKELKKFLKKDVVIKSGFKSRNKIIEVK